MAPQRPCVTPGQVKSHSGDLDACSSWTLEIVHSADALDKWVTPADAIEAEWKVLARSISKEEFERLSDFRALVQERGLDGHMACTAPGAAPHSRRAGTLLRFLRARGGQQDAAHALLCEALDWRRDFQVDTKLRSWRTEWDAGCSPKVVFLKKYDYMGLLGTDREGLPVYIHRHSQGDLGGLVRELGDETLLLHMVRIIEDHLAEAQVHMLKTGRFLVNFVEIHDVGNYGFVPNWLPRGLNAAPFFKNNSPIFDKVYPERVRVCFIVRAPAAFSAIWRLASPLVPEATKGKIRLKGYAANSWIKEMEAVLPPETIPAWLRDDDVELLAQAKPWGGMVPRGDYAVAKRNAEVAAE